MFRQLEDLDFTDDLVKTYTRQHLQNKTTSFNGCAEQTGLKISTAKTKVMVINTKLTDSITINSNPVETVEDFTYVGSIINSDNGTKKDIQERPSKACTAFARPKFIWRQKMYSKNTKTRLYNNVKPVMVYGLECCRPIQSDLQNWK
jgi:hypothetical protein